MWLETRHFPTEKEAKEYVRKLESGWANYRITTHPLYDDWRAENGPYIVEVFTEE